MIALPFKKFSVKNKSNHNILPKTQSKACLRVPNIPHVNNGLEDNTLNVVIHKVKKRLAFRNKTSYLFPQLLSTSKRVSKTKHKQNNVSNTKKRALQGNVPTGVVNVHSTRNNTLLTLSTSKGRAVKGGWASGGSVGFKNSRKSTTYAAQAAAKKIALMVKKLRIKNLRIKLNGTGRAKGAVVRVFQQSSLKILAIRECTPTAHNGCRPPKIRRI